VDLRSTVCGACAVLASLLLSLPASALVATLTFVEGKGTIISGPNGYLPVAGVRLRQCDIVRTGPQSQVQVEFEDGGKIELGPESRLLFDLPYTGDAVIGPHFLLSGWAKLTVPKREKAVPHRLGTPNFDLLVDAGVAVINVAPDGGKFFVEQGSAFALDGTASPSARTAVAAGRTYSRKSDQARGAVVDRVDPGLVSAMPAAFRDTVPSLLAQVKERNVQPKPAPDYNQAEAEAWLKAVPALRVCIFDVNVRRAQEVLERAGFKVGPIDGILGPITAGALREFQQQQGLARSGRLDPETMKALDLADRR
jgi:Putative peptidoglycan binding domain/FecR protein